MSYLIVGGTAQERKEKALKIVSLRFKISNFDLILIEGQTSIGIDQVRELGRRLGLKPYNSPTQAALIHPGELLTAAAQNALLKLLEEKEAILILTAANQSVLLPTVVSRCQIIALPAKSEIKVDQDLLTSYSALITTIVKSGVGERVRLAGEIASAKEAVLLFLNQGFVFWREVMLEKHLGRQGKLLNFFHLSPRQIINQLKIAKDYLEANVNPRLALEVFLLDLPYQGKTADFRPSGRSKHDQPT